MLHRWLLILLVVATNAASAASAPIDRHALVTRHNPTLHQVDYQAPLTVGNGGFAFTVDVTGLQTFAAAYHREGIPTETLSRWCWVQDENPRNYQLADANREFTLANGSKLGFPTNANSPAGDWLRKNPRDQPLGQVALDWTKDDGSAFVPEDVKDLTQTLDLWTGIVTSRYELGGVPVEVETACDPRTDTIAVRLQSPLVEQGKLRVRIAFPRGHDPAVKNTPGYDWSAPDAHQSKLVDARMIERTVQGTHYFVSSDHAFTRSGAHEFFVAERAGGKSLAFALTFSPAKDRSTSPSADVFAASKTHWSEFWNRAATLDLSDSTNASAAKLEKRVVLSQYLLAVQMAGDVPPQESGLTCSTWYGKHHTEMIWWHAAHFALSGHPELLAKNLEWYQAQRPQARARAQSRGLRGARWAKMVGPDGRESPGGNPLIVWNQPHLVYLCELLYRDSPRPETLQKYADLVQETAECLASMLWLDPQRGKYVLGPPLWIAQEIYDPATSQNPSFELAYWRWALNAAQEWRQRRGLARESHWDDILQRLAPLPVRDGKYVALESHPDTWDNVASRHDHPEMLMPLGFLPESAGADPAIMQRTFDAVMADWDWETKIWGWDYPMIAMTATRLGEPSKAMEILLRDGPNNRYTANGHCPQRSDVALVKDAPAGGQRSEIAVYLPANGAFLSAVALMVAGWDGCAEEHPGFAKDGTWVVRAEGWRALP